MTPVPRLPAQGIAEESQPLPRRSRRWRSLFEAGLRLGGALLQVLAAVLVARLASPEPAGHFFVGFAVATLIAVIGRAGYDQAMTRWVAADYATGQPHRVCATVDLLLRRFTGRMAWACPMLLLACAAVGWLAPTPSVQAQALLPFVLAAPFMGIAALTGVALQAAGRPVLSVCSTFLVHNLCLLAAALLPASLREAGAFGIAFLLGCLLAALFGALALKQTLGARRAATAAPEVSAQDQATHVATVLALARNNAWTVIGNLVLVWGPLGLVGALSSPLDAARFGIASRCAQLVSFALPALNFVLAPRFAALRATGGQAELRGTLIGSLLLSLALSSVVAVPMILLAAPIMNTFGADYAAAATLLILLAAAQWANGASGAAIQFLAMTGSERPLRRIFVLSAAAALAVGLPLVAMHGATGAGQLALGSSLLLNLLCTATALHSIRRPSPHLLATAEASVRLA